MPTAFDERLSKLTHDFKTLPDGESKERARADLVAILTKPRGERRAQFDTSGQYDPDSGGSRAVTVADVKERPAWNAESRELADFIDLGACISVHPGFDARQT